MKTLFLSLLLLAVPSLAVSATLEWDRNTESDMKEYRVWICSTPGCIVQRTGNTVYAVVAQPAVGVKPSAVLPLNFQGSVAVDAGDLSGNRSPLSARLDVLDTQAPVAPTGLILVP